MSHEPQDAESRPSREAWVSHDDYEEPASSCCRLETNGLLDCQPSHNGSERIQDYSGREPNIGSIGDTFLHCSMLDHIECV